MIRLIKRNRWFFIILLILAAAWAFFYPLQRMTATHALNRYLIERGVAAENICEVQTTGDVKRGGYYMYVNFESEKDLVYVYWYKYDRMEYEEADENRNSENLFAGMDVNEAPDANSIVTLFENRYGRSEAFRYSFWDFLADLFAQKMLFKAEHFPIYPWDFISLW